MRPRSSFCCPKENQPSNNPFVARAAHTTATKRVTYFRNSPPRGTCAILLPGKISAMPNRSSAPPSYSPVRGEQRFFQDLVGGPSSELCRAPCNKTEFGTRRKPTPCIILL